MTSKTVAWQPPSGAVEDRNTSPIRTTITQSLVATALRGGRGSQPGRGVVVLLVVLVWQPPSGAVEDRNPASS